VSLLVNDHFHFHSDCDFIRLLPPPPTNRTIGNLLLAAVEPTKQLLVLNRDNLENVMVKIHKCYFVLIVLTNYNFKKYYFGTNIKNISLGPLQIWGP